MPTITISIAGSAAIPDSVIGTVQITDANLVRIATKAIVDRHNAIVQTPATDTDPAVMRDPTPSEAIKYKAMDFVQGLTDETLAWEQQQAAQAASAAISPITTS